MAQQASGNSQDDALGLVLLGGIVLVGLILCWMFFKVKIVYAVLKYCYWVMYPWAWLCSATGFTNAFPVRWVGGLVLAATKPESVSFLGIVFSLNKASIFFYPFLVYPLINGIKAHGHVLLSLRTNHGFWSMVRRQSESFPYTIPVIRFEERWKKMPSEKIELRSRALMPDEFAAMHNLLVTKQGERQLDVVRAKEVFFNQLGRNLDVDKLLTDPVYLAPHEAALFVIFAQRVGERSKASRDTASKMIHKICRSCAPDKLIVNRTAKGNQYDFSEVFDFNVGNVLLATKRPGVMQLLHEHQTVTTMLMRMLYEARKDGKLPCAHFTWLKLVDRHLWYCLQGVTPKQIARGFVEAGADNALFWNEMVASENGYRLKEKLIDNAITALEHRLLQGRVIIKPSIYYVEDHF